MGIRRNPALRGYTLGRNLRKGVVDVRGFRDMAMVNFYNRKGTATQTYLADGKRRLRMSFDPDTGRLTIRDLRRRRTATLDLVPLAEKWSALAKAKAKSRARLSLGREMTVDLSRADMRLRLHFSRMSGKIVDGQKRITGVQFLLLIGDGAG